MNTRGEHLGRRRALPSRAVAVAALWSALAAAVGLGVCACGTVGDALGQNKAAPDEFRVVTKAPLVVPPDYALRPPAPGEPRPQELEPQSQARVALLGARETVDRDDAEKSFVAKAGAEKADPLIRYVVDDQFGAVSHKTKSFADRVMFWRKGDPQNTQVATAEAAADTPDPIDPATAQARIKALTGNAAVVIKRTPEKTGLKLPGL